MVSPVLDGERLRDLLAAVADGLGERPELLLLLGGHPSLDDDVLRVLLHGKGIVVSQTAPQEGTTNCTRGGLGGGGSVFRLTTSRSKSMFLTLSVSKLTWRLAILVYVALL